MNYFLIKDKLSFEKKSKHKASEGNINGKYPFFTSSPILNKNIDSFDYNGEYLIFGTGGSPSIHHYNGKFATSTDCLVYNTTSKEIDLKFIYYYIKSNSNILENGFHGAGLKHISSNYINNIKVPLISLEKQKQIVFQLEKLEKLKEKRERNIQRCDELIKSIFYDLFGNPSKHKDWKLIELKEILKVKNGFAFKSEHFTEDKGFPIIRIRDLKKKEINTYYNGDFSDSYVVKSGDLLIGMDGEFNAIIWDNKAALLNQRICKLYDFKNCNKLYIYFAILKKLKEIEAKTSFVTVKHISSSQILDIKIKLPPLELQTEFSKKVEKIEKLKEKQIKSKEEIDNLFNGLMQKYFEVK